MKRIILSAAALLALATTMTAQTWNMIITHTDGTKQQILTSKVQDVTFEELKDQNADQVLIKEIYNGGVMKDDNATHFHIDKCIILYNNCSQRAIINNLCIGTCPQYNAEAGTMSHLYSDGKLVYDGDGFLPLINGIWYFPNPVIIEPYSQIVVNIHGAIDNTQTVTNSVNYANKDYYCMYDPDYVTEDVTLANARSYNNTMYYPAPSDVIPTSHYLKTIKYGQSNAWTFSTTSPATILFQAKDVDIKEYFEDSDNYWYGPGEATTPVWRNVKIPNEWVIDGVEMFNAAKVDASQKRITADIDAGRVLLTNKLGHVAYRNVDKAATESLAENAGKIVYNYTLGVDSSTDPSGIDAEASIKNGAHIIYQDTNNSTVDFHERQKCSLRGE